MRHLPPGLGGSTSCAGLPAISPEETCCMKVLSSPSCEVEEALHAKLAERYSSFIPEFMEF